MNQTDRTAHCVVELMMRMVHVTQDVARHMQRALLGSWESQSRDVVAGWQGLQRRPTLTSEPGVL